ncbi:hypothetical protein B0H21DRAFT_561975 [Amylocystis lapponica]|nr:hypothetical protein B0H21DRAFT_561975 [Amylocystis lapponica]
MARQLRSRASRPNYAALFDYDDEGPEAGPSSQQLPVDDDDDGSGSDFAPDNAAEDQVDEDVEDMDAVAEEDEDQQDGSHDLAISERDDSVLDFPNAAGRRPRTSANGKRKNTVSLAPGLSHSASRQMYALPSVHHRHRAGPIYRKAGTTERLAKLPAHFEPETVVSTSSWSVDTSMTDRINKAHGYNVGPGPLWELLEDRGWYKEANQGDGGEKERNRRPRVHRAVPVGSYEILSLQDASSYLPSDVVTTNEGLPKPPPPIACSFGPFGQQTRIEMTMFDTLPIADFIPGSSSHVFNAGAPVWGLDWCPIHPDDRAYYGQKQYLAVAPFPSQMHEPLIGVRVKKPAHACIEIWSLSSPPNAIHRDNPANVNREAGSKTTHRLHGEMRCEMVVCIDSGPAFELKWCPLPSNDAVQAADGNGIPTTRKLGLIGGTFEDGSFSLYAIPDPASIRPESDSSEPICVKFAEPLIRLALDETLFWALDWANSEVVALGCTNGSIAVYNLSEGLKSRHDAPFNLLPTHYISVHQSAIRALAWVRVPGVSASGEQTTDDPTVIASGGYDGVECLTDLRDGTRNVINRTRDVINTLCYSTYCSSAITIDHENIVKAYSISPSMLGRGHTLLEPDGPAWSVDVSDYHPQLAVGVTDGSCLTTNTLRSTRRGGIVPFLVHKIYQLDYSRKLGEYRMLEQFLPKEMRDRPTASRNKIALPVGTGAWPREVGVQRVVWNAANGLGRAGLLASGTGAGLCRVDWLGGHWMKGRIPYGGVEGIRKEGVGMDEDESD